jgi:KUP system potassium uptake protein
MSRRSKGLFILVGLIGVSLFYGDSAITPAISVLSAVEGLTVISPSLSFLVLPATLIILAGLFWIQKYGTAVIGRLFGPIMLMWFGVIAAGGIGQIWLHPDVLTSLSPLTALQFLISQPLIAFIAMGAVVLTITGAEALYADMGHFGRAPIARAWFLIVFPALLLCYMGQGALILHNPADVAGPFFLLFPEITRIPVILLATLATLIASQSVISGAFSLTKQAVQLDYLPKMLIRHTSTRVGGQIYVPIINGVLFVAVVSLVLLFGSSQKLANAFGLAVSGTLMADTILYLAVLRVVWQRSLGVTALAVIAFLSIDLLFVTSSLPKVLSGGWFPVIMAIVIFVLIDTWVKGQRIINAERQTMEGPMLAFIEDVRSSFPAIKRVPGQAVYIGHHADYAPLALRATVEGLHELPRSLIIVTVQISSASHVPDEERATFDNLGYNDGIGHLNLAYGYHDTPNIPKTLASLRGFNSEFNIDTLAVPYFVSLGKIVPTKRHNLARWRKTIYCLMDRNALSTNDYYKLPTERTFEMRSMIKL